MSAGGHERTIDVNCDLGEGFGVWRLTDDDALLDLVTSANVACGAHAGDPSTMRRVCSSAAARGVAVGAQFAYPDLAGFGRRFLDIDPGELTDVVIHQICGLDGIARIEGTAVTYVKPHGALYHAVAVDEAQAGAVVQATVAASAAVGRQLVVLGAPGSVLLERAAAERLDVVPEGFCDRGYDADGHLVPRGEPGAIIDDPATAARRACRLVTEGVLRDVTGHDVAVGAASLCVHGDTPGAVAVARAVRDELRAAGIRLVPFAPPPAARAADCARWS